MDILGLGPKIDVDFILDPKGQRKQVEVKLDDNKKALQYIYYDGEDVNGTVKKSNILNKIYFYHYSMFI